MKKVMSLILALALVMSLAIPAFAATNEGGNTNIDVKAQYSSAETTTDTISVNVAWGAMEFTYHVGSTKTWNATTHTYTTTSDEGTWSAAKDTNVVTITNHSNVGVKAELSFAAGAAYNTVTGSFDNATLTLPSAVDKAVDDESLVGKATLTLDGTLADTVTELTQVGTITVKIAKNA